MKKVVKEKKPKAPITVERKLLNLESGPDKLEVLSDGYGFLLTTTEAYANGSDDSPAESESLIRLNEAKAKELALFILSNVKGEAS